MPAGRPTLYKPEYCEEVIEAGARGYSLTAFAGMIRVCRDTIDEWRNQHQEFSVSCKTAKAVRTHFLETGLIAAETGPLVQSRRFALINSAPEEWTEKVVNEHTGKDGGPIQISDEARARALAAFLVKTGAKG